MKSCTAWLKSVRYYTNEAKSCKSCESVTDRQEQVAGFQQSTMNKLRVVQIGAGGLGGEICQGLVRKGVGFLRIFDGDTVELSNLSRQFFYKKDLYRNKAICLASNLVKEGVRRTEIISYPFMFQKGIEEGISIDCDIVICAPDNDETRVFVSKCFHKTKPVIFTGLDHRANTGYIFIQKPNGETFLDAFSRNINRNREPCPNSAAIIDVVKVVAGYVLFAVDSVVMSRKSNWSYRQFFLGGFIPEIIK